MVVDANHCAKSRERPTSRLAERGGVDPDKTTGPGSVRPRVLIADDEEMVRLVAEVALTKAGFEVQTARSGDEALAAFPAFRPDIVMCDVLMPGMDGFEVCEALRRMPGGEHVPIIMLTGLEDVESIERAYAVGATEFTIKPVNPTLLPRHVRFILRASQALEKSRRSEERYALAVKGANDGLWDWDLTDNTIYYSPRWKHLLAFEEHEIGSSIDEWLERIHPSEINHVRRELQAHLEGRTEYFETEYRILNKHRSYVWMLTRGVAVTDQRGLVSRMAGSMTDVSKRREAQERLQYDALHDSLTDLPNRALFLDRLQHCIDLNTRGRDHSFAVLFIDIDRFKTINDSLGHLVGDNLLVAVAGRLSSMIRAGDTLARLGGDEFVILYERVEAEEEAAAIGERIQAALGDPIKLDGHNVVVTASIGIAMSKPDYLRPEDVLRDADVAMYHAKGSGRARCQLFDTSMHVAAMRALKTESELRAALERHEFAVVYQPIVGLHDDEPWGFEALLRWHHPSRGVLRPKEFIGVAEDSGLIVPIGHEVLRCACEQLREWQRRWPQMESWIVCVNMTATELGHPKLQDVVRDVLQETGLAGSCLKIEISEQTLIENQLLALEVMATLRELDVRLSIDDFGTGYASFGHLHRFPFEMLKIDRSFIHGLENEPSQAEIVKTISALAHRLGMTVTAEGSETQATLDYLRRGPCEFVQGYSTGFPQGVEELTRRLENRFAADAHARPGPDGGAVPRRTGPKKTD